MDISGKEVKGQKKEILVTVSPVKDQLTTTSRCQDYTEHRQGYSYSNQRSSSSQV